MQKDTTIPQEELSWFYHRGRWSRIQPPFANEAPPPTTEYHRSASRRKSLREYSRVWLDLGLHPIPSGYMGLLASVYAFTGRGQAPGYLIWLVSLCSQDAIYVGDLPDLLELLALLTPLVSHGMFADAYTRRSE